MDQSRLTVAFLNLGHFLDHLAMLIYATAVLVMTSQFGLSYQDMLPLSIGGFIAFGGVSLPSGWLGDRWGRRNMMVVFFLGLGAALILAGEPVNNRRLAELMDCSPGGASRRVAQLEGVIRKARKGREVLISLH